ncbi:YceI family protein [Nonomuraea sp. 3N208]|uniref:YceI family protein n=1 Tax=Nonomuraea sp. 3N208 TaxID=3457421 RepID=UPI003FCE48C3
MSITAGSYTLGPDSGRLLVKTTRTGLGAKAGHDLTLEVTRWRGDATIDTTAPAHSSLAVEVDAESIEVREGTGGVKPLTRSDRGDIERTIREKILHTDRHPTITFRMTRVEGTEESFRLEGDLTLVGVARPVMVQGSVTEGRVHGSAVIEQSRWGIKPYSAFFGALKLSDDVQVEFDLGLVAKQ